MGVELLQILISMHMTGTGMGVAFINPDFLLDR